MKIHYLSGIAKGMYHLHKNKIVHRDLAARNILVRIYYVNKLFEANLNNLAFSRQRSEDLSKFGLVLM